MAQKLHGSKQCQYVIVVCVDRMDCHRTVPDCFSCCVCVCWRCDIHPDPRAGAGIIVSPHTRFAHLTISPAITRTCTSSICHKFVFATEKKPVRCQPPTPPIQVLYMYTGSPYSNRTESVPGGVKSNGNLEDTPLFALFDCSFQNFFRIRIPCLHV